MDPIDLRYVERLIRAIERQTDTLQELCETLKKMELTMARNFHSKGDKEDG